jgi:hypothetical protein
MKRINLLIIIGAMLPFASCTPKMPIYTKPSSNNKDYKVSYLFEHDGCKVYRFVDGFNAVYFTSCQGETSFQQDSVTVIKNRTK